VNSRNPSFRQAGTADATIVAAIAERTFRATFADQNSATDMDALCQSAYGTEIQRRELADPARETWILDDHGTAVGYFMLRRGAPPEGAVGTVPVEILRFYLDQHQQGTGAGRQMMTFALERCTRMGADAVWLGVWEENLRAIAFYERFGFSVFGSHIFRVGSDPQTDLLLHRRIDRSSHPDAAQG
jgi:diamine N-acetyltransferase